MYRSFVSSSGGRAVKLFFAHLTLVCFVYGEINNILVSKLKVTRKLVTGSLRMMSNNW